MALLPLMPGGSMAPGAPAGPGGPAGPGPLGTSPQGPSGLPPSPPPGPPGGDPLSALMGNTGPPAGGDPGSIMALLNQLEMQISDLARALPGSEDIAEAMTGLLQQWKTRAVISMAPAAAQVPGVAGMM